MSDTVREYLVFQCRDNVILAFDIVKARGTPFAVKCGVGHGKPPGKFIAHLLIIPQVALAYKRNFHFTTREFHGKAEKCIAFLKK
jgi:hypothetical protein